MNTTNNNDEPWPHTAPSAVRRYRVAYSARQNSWYIADESGECVSGLYDTDVDAEIALTQGAF